MIKEARKLSQLTEDIEDFMLERDQFFTQNKQHFWTSFYNTCVDMYEKGIDLSEKQLRIIRREFNVSKDVSVNFTDGLSILRDREAEIKKIEATPFFKELSKYKVLLFFIGGKIKKLKKLSKKQFRELVDFCYILMKENLKELKKQTPRREYPPKMQELNYHIPTLRYLRMNMYRIKKLWKKDMREILRYCLKIINENIAKLKGEF